MHISQPYIKPILFVAIGVFLVLGAILLIIYSGILTSSSVEIIDSSSLSTEGLREIPQSTQIYIEVAGEVEKPGVYALQQGARVQDALLMSGQLLSTADFDFVEKTINKAAKLTDGQKIYIPKKNEKSVSVLGTNTSKFININNGSQSELESLPGVGPATASKIIAGRPYGSVDELISKKAVGISVFEKIKDLIRLY